ncbi:hypothetical protein HQO12_24370 [Rhodococcus fascians]|uniref:hypothetical protein n=1 Tax=Rhodococcoides fascians TaxID=1828 RepID=UPI00195F3BFF|nr:hypothetical protein [Rhodococcus fascians]MBM7246239.1 hypothetical protein [Rhodococcus fascians]MBY3812050.1 hypothetical protein [Rhodococcus fascians]MBY3843541.1 hypothetical protein [Rhodococcus fascians]MBY3846169.1 hypothetical protein [Rhodococcus fascians]MBY3853335.1 hypothetical protein [Rhodococcus fascians]
MTEPTPSDLTALRARAAGGDQDAIDGLVEQGTVDDLRSLAAAGNSDAVDILVERAGEARTATNCSDWQPAEVRMPQTFSKNWTATSDRDGCPPAG